VFPKLKLFLPIQEFSICSNDGHLRWSSDLWDIIQNWDHQRITYE
jgi:hypothetical protein